MIFQNQDLELNKFFIKNDFSEIVTDIRQLKNQKLNRATYFRPTNCPIINVADSNLGSCFEDYIIPTGSYRFHKTDNGIVGTPIEKHLSLTEYTDTVFHSIQTTIKEIYQSHSVITLCYSGGIDSMVILSYIIAQGLLPRTRIVCFENRTQIDPTCLHVDATQRERVTTLLDSIRSQAKTIEWQAIELADIACGFNNQQLEHLKCYSTNTILQKYHDSAFIFGWHGNQVLLHKYVFIDEIILSRTTAKQEFVDLLSSASPFYTSSLSAYDFTRVRVRVEQVHMLQKPWDCLNGNNNNHIYSPIGNDLTFNSLRQLDYSKIPVNTIADALVAREIIFRNVGDTFNNYIGVESLSDGDSLKDIVIPLDLINKELLVVPNNLNHNAEGAEFINYEIEQAYKNKSIPINSLLSIKALDWLSKL